MTGFGEAERTTAAGVLRVEIRSVNHRHFSLNYRSPQALDRYEPQVREWLKPMLPRGHMNCSVRLEREAAAPAGPGLTLDVARARQYVDALRALRDELGVAGDVDVATVARFTDILVREEPESGPEIEPDELRPVIEEAAAALIVMREQEGRSLLDDLVARLEAIGVSLGEIEVRAPERLIAERDRLRRAVAELADGAGVDEDRLAREIALLAERWDLSEEIVRLRSHLQHFRGMLEDDPQEPVGKRLAFLVQEMHREANTIGSKANDAPIEHQVVEIKNEIERLREQVENVE